MDFVIYNERVIYRIQGLFLEVALSEKEITDVFFSKNNGEDYAEEFRIRKRGTIDLKVDLNYHINSPYKMFQDIVVFFKRYSKLDGTNFNYRAAEQFALDTTTRKDYEVDYFIKPVMHYISYDIFGTIVEGDDYLEIVSDEEIKELFKGIDNEGYYIYGTGNIVKVMGNKIDEGIDLSNHARNFVIWVCLIYLKDLLEESEVIFRQNRMEIHVGHARFLYRFEDTRVIYCTRSSQRCEVTPNFSPDLDVDSCIDFVDAVFNYVLETIGNRTKSESLNTF